MATLTTEYTIKEGDTLQEIAGKLLGDSTKWLDIAEYNHLNYPYTQTSTLRLYSTGYITFNRDPSVLTAISIPSGTEMYSEDGKNTYTTTVSVAMAVGINRIEVPIVSVNQGINSQANIGTVNTLETLSGILSCINLDKVSVSQYYTRGTGTVRVYIETGYGSTVPIPYGTVFETEDGKQYYATEAKTLATYIDVPIRSFVAGMYGNTPMNTIIVCKELEHLYNMYNTLSITNAIDNKVAVVGDKVYIPNTDPTMKEKRVLTSTELSDAMYGVDLAISSDGGLAFDISGDLQVVKGIENLKQAIELKLGIPIGTYKYHPNYGNNFASVIGTGETKNRLKILETLVKATILSDPRVASIEYISLGASQGIAYVDLGIRTISNTIEKFIIK